jgi:hypothetical protein
VTRSSHTFIFRVARAAIFLLLAFTSRVEIAHAQLDKVQVEFHIVDPVYRNELGTQVPAAERSLQDLAVIALQQRLRFVTFTSDSAADHILILLGDDPRALNEPVRFHLKLVSGSTHPELTWIFRAQAELIKPLSFKHRVEEKVRDVELVGAKTDSVSQQGEFRRKFSSISMDSLVNTVFRLIPVANKGVLRDGPPDPLWELPLNRDETCMPLETHLMVEHLLERTSRVAEELPLEVRAAGPPDGVVAPIQARVVNPETHLLDISRLGGPDVTVTIKAVYVLHYEGPQCSSTVTLQNSGLLGSTTH